MKFEVRFLKNTEIHIFKNVEYLGCIFWGKSKSHLSIECHGFGDSKPSQRVSNAHNYNFHRKNGLGASKSREYWTSEIVFRVMIV